MQSEINWDDLSQGELEQRIGELLFRQELGNESPTAQESRVRGRRWFEATLEIYRSKLCGNDRLRSLLKDEKAAQRNQVIATISDLIGKAAFDIVPHAAFAVMIIRFGFGRICPEEKE